MNVKKVILQTFIDIGNKEGFDKVNINRIVKECDIARTTFYYHFKDVPDVINYFMQDKIENIMSECIRIGNMRAGIAYSTKEIVYNFPEYRKLLDSKWNAYAEKYLYENWVSFAEKMFTVNQKDVSIKLDERNFLIRFISGAVCHFIVHGDHEEISPEVFAQQLGLLLKARFDSIKKKIE